MLHLPNRPFLGASLQGTITYPVFKALLKMIFLFPRWDMLIPWRVYVDFREGYTHSNRESSQLKSTNHFRKAIGRTAHLLGVPQLFFGLTIFHGNFVLRILGSINPKKSTQTLNPNFSKSQQTPPLHSREKEISKIKQLQTSREWLLILLTEETPTFKSKICCSQSVPVLFTQVRSSCTKMCKTKTIYIIPSEAV